MSEEVAVNSMSLFNFMSYLFGEIFPEGEFDFGTLFPIIADSFLTMFVLFFIASWVLSIFLDLSKKGGK